MIFLGTDHQGYKLKEIVKQFLEFLQLEYEDLGAFDEETDDDYPDYAKKVVKKMKGKNDKAILFCGTGVGMCIAANRYKDIRAVSGSSDHAVLMGRVDNNVNVLCLAGRLTNEHTAKRLVKIFLDSPFSGETRHKRRIKKLDTK